MTNGLIDELARILATPMPRRRAVRTVGAALAAGVLHALSPGRLFAGAGRGAQAGQHARCFVAIKNGTHEGGGYYPAYSKCCTGPNADLEHPNLMSWVCPKDWGCGTAGACTPVCAAGTAACGRGCCDPGLNCYQGRRCLAECPATSVKCGTECCTANQACIGGKCCDVCGGNKICCDPATTFCCREMGQPNSQGRCCKTASESCCGVGPDGAQTRMCCPTTNACVKQLPKGIGGHTSASPWVCCPPERQVPDDVGSSRIVGCCDPSQVSLQGKFLVGQGIQGMCCDADKICGSGASLTCCQTGQSCIGGRLCA